MAVTPIPDAPVVPQYPALGSLTFNQEAYAYGTAMPNVTQRIHEIAQAARSNAVESGAQAQAAAQERVAAVSETTAIKNTAVSETTAIANTARDYRDAAATSAGEALESKNAADTSAGEALARKNAAATSADAAEASRIAASKLNLGSKATAPKVDNQGEPLLTGATYYDTTLDRWRVWTGVAWGEGVSAVAGVSSINGLTGDVVLPPPQFFAYASRATLRSQTPANQELAFVDGLGLFVFQENSDEPDDDESCFATATGRWLLQCPSWDVVDAWQLPEVEERDAYDEDEPQRFAASFAAKVLTGSATCAITSVTTVSSVSFTGTVTGASVGDRVIATPPAELGATSAETGRLSYHARVSAANTVTITLTNASAAVANTNAAIRAAWPITVIKS